MGFFFCIWNKQTRWMQQCLCADIRKGYANYLKSKQQPFKY